MKRSLIAGAAAVGLVFAAFATPATVAASAEVSAASAAECDGTAEDEAAAVALAAVCAEDVRVLGASGDGAALFAEPEGSMLLETSASIVKEHTELTALRPTGPSGYGWTGTQWVGYCDPAEYAKGCATAGIQRLAWQFDGIELLAGLEPEDITSAVLYAHGADVWLDEVNCTPNRLDLYDIPRISASTDWASTAEWTEELRVGGIESYGAACEQSPEYTGLFDFDAMQLAVNAARANRSSVTVGVRAADETCMTCGWNSFEPRATLVIRFNRAPFMPTDLTVETRAGQQSCDGEPVVRDYPFLTASIVDPDPRADATGAGVVYATFRLARADAPDKVLWEQEGWTLFGRPTVHQASIPINEDLALTYGRYVWTVFGTDVGGRVGPSASCVFNLDYVRPEPPVVTPVVGGQAVYTKGIGSGRGGVGVPGSFLIESPSNDVRTYRYGINSQAASWEIAATENTVLNFTPTRSGRNYLTVEAIDRAGNRSLPATYEFYVGSGSTATTPPAITVTGPTSFTLGDVPTALVTLSADAVTPYGTVTVKSGSTTVGSASFDERTEELSLDGQALGVGTKTLTFTYSAFPDAPTWSTQRTVTIKPPAFSTPVSPSVSGTPRVGRTLTATRGPWTPEPTAVKYQWRLDGRAVSGATAYNWKLPATAKGKKVTVAITGSKSGYTTKTVISPATAAVMAGVFVAPTPTIAGSARVGSVLQVYRGTWTPLPSTVTHQWRIDGRPVAGATRSKFRVPTSARGKRVSVVVTGSLAGYTTKSVSRSTGLIR
ncbi:hypothetical protein ACQEVI_13355 [Promicromonospora sp. CA-289599]|uniref:hypothetical protein n=1 Tax=Promicromonospora sp. CA-289599 TaxID=3240014 RepID=UPI003D8E76C9